MPNWFWMILLQIVLILLNALFAGSEIAVLSVNEIKLDKMVKEGNGKAKTLRRLTKDPSRFLSTIQIAITLSGFLGSAFAADNFSGALTDWMISLGASLPYDVLDTISVILITIILSYFTLVFGELVPKQIAIHKTEQMALGVSGLISFIATIFAPLVKILTWSTNGVLRLLGIRPDQEEETVSEEEIIMMVEAGTNKGTIDREESELIANVFAFDDLKARDLLTHRTAMISLDIDEPETWNDVIYQSPRSFIPVYEGTKDKIIGILNTKKYFRQNEGNELDRIKASLEEPYFAWESVKADDLFAAMKRDHQNMAIILDEYGGVSGLITVYDLVESLVGNIEEDEKEITRLADGSYRILGKAGVQEVSKVLNQPIDPDLVSFNGLVYDHLQGVPEDASHSVIPFGNWDIILENVTRHRVQSAIVRPRSETESGPLNETAENPNQKNG